MLVFMDGRSDSIPVFTTPDPIMKNVLTHRLLGTTCIKRDEYPPFETHSLPHPHLALNPSAIVEDCRFGVASLSYPFAMFSMLNFTILALLFATSTTISASALPPRPNADISPLRPNNHTAEVINTGVALMNLANANTHEKRKPTPIEALNAVLDPLSDGIKNLRTAISKLSAEEPTPSQFKDLLDKFEDLHIHSNALQKQIEVTDSALSEPDSRSVLSRFNTSAPLGRGSLRTLGSERHVIESHFTRFGVALVYGSLRRLEEDTSRMYGGFYLIFDGAVFEDAERLKVETVEIITGAANKFAPLS